MNREKCEKALNGLRILEREENFKKCNQVAPQIKCDLIEVLIKEHFDNPPLGFEELEIGKPYFDTNYNEWCIVQKKNPFITVYCDETISEDEFKENRFYRKRVEE